MTAPAIARIETRCRQDPPVSSAPLFVLGTRGSPLALAQANETRRRLSEAHGWEAERIELRIIRTSGDTIQDRPLAEAGGKGLFTKEIDTALLLGEIDGAVHSAKDLPTVLPEGVALAGFLPREDVRDALISSFADTIEGLPPGASLGAASLRRQAQALRLRPDLKPELLRGNVETRLRKAESGAIGATLLAMAGLKRLGLVHRIRAPLDVERFLPAVGQGAIALTARSGDSRALAALAAIADPETAVGARGRTRLSRRARRLVPDADRGPRPTRGRPAQVPGPGAADGRLRELRHRTGRVALRRGADRRRGRTRACSPAAGGYSAEGRLNGRRRI